MEEQKNYVYMLRCADGSLYTGWTNDIQKRESAHACGKGAKYTRSRLPVRLVYLEECQTASAARKREWQLKHVSKAQKEELVLSYEKGQENG